MLKSVLSLSAALLLCTALADNREIEQPIVGEASTIATSLESDGIDSETLTTGSETTKSDSQVVTTNTEETPPRPRAKVTVRTVAADKNLVKDESDAAKGVEVMICGRERIGTGSRLSRRVCRTVQQLEKEAALRKAMVARSSNRFKRQPPMVGGRTAIKKN